MVRAEGAQRRRLAADFGGERTARREAAAREGVGVMDRAGDGRHVVVPSAVEARDERSSPCV